MRGAKTLFQAWQAGRIAGRRARNLRHGARRAGAPRQNAAPVTRPRPWPWLPGRGVLSSLLACVLACMLARTRAPRPAGWVVFGCALGTLVGAAVIAGHARHLSAAAGAPGASDGVHAADAFQATLPGLAFSVSAAPGIVLEQRGAAALLIASGMAPAAPLRLDLCGQLADGGTRLLPLHLGYQFGDVAASAGGNRLAARNVVLAAPGAPMPRIEVRGSADAPQLRWTEVAGVTGVRWIGDASGGRIAVGPAAAVPLGRDGTLVWQAGAQTAALRLVRRASAACPAAGELQVQLLRPAAAPVRAGVPSQVIAYGAVTQSDSLAPGRYQVSAVVPAALEDQALFTQLTAHGLVRLGADGQIAQVPRDLAAWRAAPARARAGTLAEWDGVALDADALKLAERLYHRADGDFVRAQIDIFNGERRLLAWRARPGAVAGAWQATVGAAAAPLALSMPAASARLFARLPQGWEPWQRVGAWPAPGSAQLAYALAHPAQGNETLTLLVLGRPGAATGARVMHATAACSGRACPAPDAAQELTLALLPGATRIVLTVAPMNAGAFAAPGDEQYRHIRVAGGKLAWQAVAARQRARAGAGAPAPVALADRNGAPLWAGGAPTPAAAAAGLAPLLGFRADQANSVAGMLGRLGGAAHAARLSLDLELQRQSQAALECIGMRRGRWDGVSCAGGAAAPPGRHAGMVILDTETGDLLAAAGAGAGEVDPANWRDVRDFDRLDPARSPLRLPALQHDGGAHQSPGSTFKVISALGLELAARRDPQLDALAGGMPLAAINALARARGFAFRTDAPAYPWDPDGAGRQAQARITNYREQQLDRRAQNGRLGLAQALTYSLNTWFAWTAELGDRSLFGRSAGGAPDLAGLEPGALDGVRPIVAMAHKLGFERPLRLDGGLLPAGFAWSAWDALQATPSHIDPIHTRHELRQMAIGLRMQATPLQMALAAAAVGQGRIVAPRLLLALDGRAAVADDGPATGVRLDRIKAGMKGVIDVGTAANAFRGGALATVRPGLYGKTGTAPTAAQRTTGADDDATATVWFTGWLEPHTVPNQPHRLAFAAFVSHSEASGGEHAAPVVAAVLRALAQKPEQKGK